MDKKSFSDLKFLRLRTNAITDPDGSIAAILFSKIPRYLFEQFKNAKFNVDTLQLLGPSLLSNESIFFYVLIDKESNVKGVFWFSVDLIEESLYVYLFSVDKEYQDKNAIKSALSVLRDLKFKKIEKIYITTTHSAAFEKNGFTRSKRIRMEMDYEI